MMLMLRSNKKARKVIYTLIGVPAPFIKEKLDKKEQKINDRLKSELLSRLK